MKIGILTFHCAHNYGAVLQAFALQEFLVSCGHEVEIIDYRPGYLLSPYYVFPERKNTILKKFFWLIGSPKHIRRALRRIPRRRIFENFISALNLSRERFFEGGIPAREYDAIIFGSDQIWNLDITRGDPVFLGGFATHKRTLKIAYAASAGATSERFGKNPALTGALKNFNAISVREQDLADALKQNLEVEIKVALDPTLLVEKSIWDKFAVSPKTARKYVLVYQVIGTPAADRIAHELAEQIGADVISIWAGYDDKQEDDLTWETPEQFVGWFKNASCVVSTSFHGTAFAIIYGKPFYYVSKGALEENRPRHILSELGLIDRIVAENPHPKFSEIDYDNARIENLRVASREFLGNALKSPLVYVDHTNQQSS